MHGDRRADDSLRVCSKIGSSLGLLTLGAGGDVDLDERGLRAVGVRQTTERAATGDLTQGGLSPTLALDGNGGGSAEILLKLVDARSVVDGRAGKGKTPLTPGLRGEFVLGRAELASGLRLLLERLLLVRVGVADLDLQLLATSLDAVVVERLDDFFARVTRLEAAFNVSC